MQVQKSTHESYKVELFAPIMKKADKYIAVLSDTSIDRDGERVGKSAFEDMRSSDGYLAGLIDHENKALNQVCEWINKEIVDIDGHTALVAEPKFFKSNPKAMVIKGMLDEGAKMGISIGAIIKEYEDQKVNGRAIRTFTKVELLEASFVGIPSNTHGQAMAVAKSFKIGKKKMSEELKYTQKEFDVTVTKETELNKTISDNKTEISNLNKKVADLEKEAKEESDKVKEESEKVKEESEKVKEESEKKFKALETELKASKKVALEKQKFFEGATEEDTQTFEKSINEGKLPFVRFQ